MWASLSTRGGKCGTFDKGAEDAIQSIAIGSVIYSLAAVVALHCLNTGYDAISQLMSYHAVGAYGWLMASAVGAFAVSALALAFALERGAARVSRIGTAFLFGAGPCLAIASIFPTDVAANNLPITVAGAIHVAASYLVSPCLVAAALLLSRRFDDARRRDAARFALALVSWISLVVLVIVNQLNPHIGGIGQRIFLTVIALWVIVTAFYLRERRSRFDTNRRERGRVVILCLRERRLGR